ncbi:MAG: hypothetical protein FWB98_08775 [Defluviitaleaceae bacterium]|nr:hypothetical protein [Defluviitaleaceae bacterium]
MSRRIRSDANTSHNVINISGNPIKREAIYVGTATITPGCIVVPYQGEPTIGEGLRGDTGVVTVPTSSVAGFAVADVSSANGMNLVAEYNQNDQIPVLYFRKGDIANVRIDATATVNEGTVLYADATGTGFTSTVTGNALGIAREALVVNDPDVPTFIKMEVLA